MIEWLKWLYPGLGIKRWIVLLLFGFSVLLLGCAGLAGVSSVFNLPRSFDVAYQYLPAVAPTVLSVLLIVAGGTVIALAVRSLVKAILDAYLPDNITASRNQLLGTLMEKNVLSKGPKIVAIGGGTGLAATLEGLRELSTNITAIVTVADNGGSSGRLRTMDLPAPGDIRNCILALANAGEPMKTLFNYRFKDDAPEGLRGHNFGNLLIATLSQITGDFTEAVRMACSILDVRGLILPATPACDVHVCAEYEDGSVVCGETEVGKTPKSIVRAFLQPDDCPATPDALKAIAEADLIVMGPGSLYTSVLATLLVPGIAEAVVESNAHKVYICNAMTQVAETLGYSAYDHVQALLKHTGSALIDTVLVNTAPIKPAILKRYREEGADAVSVDSEQLAALGLEIITGDFIEQHKVVRHDPKKVSWHLANILWRKRGDTWRFDFGS